MKMCNAAARKTVADTLEAATPRGNMEALSNTLVGSAQFAHEQLSDPERTAKEFMSNVEDNVKDFDKNRKQLQIDDAVDMAQEGTALDDNPTDNTPPGTPGDDEPEIDPWLGRLLASRRNQGLGKGISANMLTGGTGIRGKASTNRRTLLGA
jgi:hypothetical protein